MSVYLKLLHGRDDPAQHMDNWGFDGPVLGPFEAVHFTYTTHVRCFPVNKQNDEIELSYHDDMLVHDGKYYGDFEIAADFGQEESLAVDIAVARFHVDTINDSLVRLIELCEQRGLDLDMLINTARHMHSGQPDVDESG